MSDHDKIRKINKQNAHFLSPKKTFNNPFEPKETDKKTHAHTFRSVKWWKPFSQNALKYQRLGICPIDSHFYSIDCSFSSWKILIAWILWMRADAFFHRFFSLSSCLFFLLFLFLLSQGFAVYCATMRRSLFASLWNNDEIYSLRKRFLFFLFAWRV